MLIYLMTSDHRVVSRRFVLAEDLGTSRWTRRKEIRAMTKHMTGTRKERLAAREKQRSVAHLALIAMFATVAASFAAPTVANIAIRSEEHTSELQSLTNLVCRLLLEK